MKQLLLFFFFACSFELYAQQVTQTEAINVAIRVMEHRGISALSRDIDTVYRLEKHGNTLVYEVFFQSGESVLLSGNKKCKPVIGYSTSTNNESVVSVFDNNEFAPCCFKDFFNNYVNQIDSSFNSEQDDAICLDWQEYQYNEREVHRNTIIVGPLLETQWGQSSSNDNVDPYAYNFYVTENGTNCDKCLAGCGPVALAQLMRYWNYPVCSPILDKQFDWCNMTDRLYVNSYNYEDQRNSVSYLIRKCGEALSAQYCSGGCGTSSFLNDVPNVLRSFSYNCGDYAMKPDNPNDIALWKMVIINNLYNKMPVYYYGKTVDGVGHFFICDGYDSDMFFHFNWGWNGSYNNYWLDIDNLTVGYNFNYRQGAIFNIKPSSEQDMCDFTLSLEDFYRLYNSLHPFTPFCEYDITPTTTTVLESATSSSPASYRTIPAGDTAEYVAHKEVILQPGFTAEYGSDFTARIEPCDACEERVAQAPAVEEPCAWPPSGPTNVNGNRQDIDTLQQEKHLYRKGDTTILFQQSELTLFPNPATGTLTIQTTNLTDNIQLFDIAGHSVYRWYVESRTDNSTTLNIANIPTGNYILRIQTSDGKTHIGRFAKK